MTSASRNIVAFPRAGVRRRGHEIAFLPAALEITESPPSPIGRAIGASIIAALCVALVWASLSSEPFPAVDPRFDTVTTDVNPPPKPPGTLGITSDCARANTYWKAASAGPAARVSAAITIAH